MRVLGHAGSFASAQAASLEPSWSSTRARRIGMIQRAACARCRTCHGQHAFACQWCEQGGNLAALQQILGHASIETTQRYARLSDEAVMREARRLVCQVGDAQ